VVEDLSTDERFRSNPLVTADTRRALLRRLPGCTPRRAAVGTLCLLDHAPRSFSDAERETLQDLAGYVQQELGVREEYERAAQVQRGLLPRQVPALRGYQIAGACRPARAVGGDFFDWHPVSDGIGFTVADVMGKGFAGAIMMASVRAVLRSASQQDSASSALISAAAVLDGDLQETGTFVTLFHARLCALDGTVRFADAGHGLTLVVRADGGAERILSTGMPLGAWPDSSWDEAELQLHPGDVLVSVSDGVLDLYDGSLSALDEVAGLVRGCPDAQTAVDRVIRVARRQELVDDVTVLVVRRSDAEEER
jgi:serine phosphatase RsbU (regulator of sigma subunit)